MASDMPLKCNAGKTLPKIYFSYPDKNPGDIDTLAVTTNSFLQEGTIAHLIFLEILPDIAGVVVFLFFLVSSSFIVYGIIRHLYTDHMVPYKKKTLKKLGKYPAEKRRKRYQAKRNQSQSSVSKPSTQSQSRPSLGSESVRLSKSTSKSYGKIGSKKDRPYFLDDLSESSSESDTKLPSHTFSKPESIKTVISFTSPPMRLDTRPKVIGMPGDEYFPELPDVPGKKVQHPKPVTPVVDDAKPYFLPMAQDDPGPSAQTKKESKRESHVTWEEDQTSSASQVNITIDENVGTDTFPQPSKPKERPRSKPNVSWDMKYKSDDELSRAAKNDLERLIARRQRLRERRSTSGEQSSVARNLSTEKPKTHPQPVSEPPHNQPNNSIRKSIGKETRRPSDPTKKIKRGSKKNSKAE